MALSSAAELKEQRDLEHAIFNVPWKTPSQYAAYVNAVQRSTNTRAKSGEDRLSRIRMLPQKAVTDVVVSNLRESRRAKELGLREAQRRKVREIAQLLPRAATPGTLRLASSGGKPTPAPRAASALELPSVVQLKSVTTQAGGQPRTLEQSQTEMPVIESHADRRKVVAKEGHYIFEDEVGLIDIDDGDSGDEPSDGGSHDSGTTPSPQRGSPDDSTTKPFPSHDSTMSLNPIMPPMEEQGTGPMEMVPVEYQPHAALRVVDVVTSRDTELMACWVEADEDAHRWLDKHLEPVDHLAPTTNAPPSRDHQAIPITNQSIAVLTSTFRPNGFKAVVQIESDRRSMIVQRWSEELESIFSALSRSMTKRRIQDNNTHRNINVVVDQEAALRVSLTARMLSKLDSLKREEDLQRKKLERIAKYRGRINEWEMQHQKDEAKQRDVLDRLAHEMLIRVSRSNQEEPDMMIDNVLGRSIHTHRPSSVALATPGQAALRRVSAALGGSIALNNFYLNRRASTNHPKSPSVTNLGDDEISASYQSSGTQQQTKTSRAAGASRQKSVALSYTTVGNGIDISTPSEEAVDATAVSTSQAASGGRPAKPSSISKEERWKRDANQLAQRLKSELLTTRRPDFAGEYQHKLRHLQETGDVVPVALEEGLDDNHDHDDHELHHVQYDTRFRDIWGIADGDVSSDDAIGSNPDEGSDRMAMTAVPLIDFEMSGKEPGHRQHAGSSASSPVQRPHAVTIAAASPATSNGILVPATDDVVLAAANFLSDANFSKDKDNNISGENPVARALREHGDHIQQRNEGRLAKYRQIAASNALTAAIDGVMQGKVRRATIFNKIAGIHVPKGLAADAARKSTPHLDYLVVQQPSHATAHKPSVIAARINAALEAPGPGDIARRNLQDMRRGSHARAKCVAKAARCASFHKESHSHPFGRDNDTPDDLPELQRRHSSFFVMKASSATAAGEREGIVSAAMSLTAHDATSPKQSPHKKSDADDLAIARRKRSNVASLVLGSGLGRHDIAATRKDENGNTILFEKQRMHASILADSSSNSPRIGGSSTSSTDPTNRQPRSMNSPVELPSALHVHVSLGPSPRSDAAPVSAPSTPTPTDASAVHHTQPELHQPPPLHVFAPPQVHIAVDAIGSVSDKRNPKVKFISTNNLQDGTLGGGVPTEASLTAETPRSPNNLDLHETSIRTNDSALFPNTSASSFLFGALSSVRSPSRTQQLQKSSSTQLDAPNGTRISPMARESSPIRRASLVLQVKNEPSPSTALESSARRASKPKTFREQLRDDGDEWFLSASDF